MNDKQLAEIEQRLSTHIAERWEHNSPFADIAALIAEVKRLQWEAKTAYAWIESQGQEVPAEWRTQNTNPPAHATPSIDAGVMGREEGT